MFHWRLKSPTEDRMRFPQATLVDRGVPRVKVQNLPSFKVLNLRKENFNCLVVWYLNCTIAS